MILVLKEQEIPSLIFGNNAAKIRQSKGVSGEFVKTKSEDPHCPAMLKIILFYFELELRLKKEVN